MIFFDVTDIVQFAARYSRVTGIQRVQLSIISLLARKYGGDALRCCFLDPRRGMLQFDPAQSSDAGEFDAESYLIELGLTKPSAFLPSRVQVKGYLRAFNHSKVLRTLKKLDVYWSALLMPKRLLKLGISPRARTAQHGRIAVSSLGSMSPQDTYVLLGAAWMQPQIWRFAQAHRDRGGDVVQMVYDLIPMLYPQFSPRDESESFAVWLDAALKYSSRFMALSAWTARDLMAFARSRGAVPQVRIVPLAHEFVGFARNERTSPPPEMHALVGAGYVLCVGTIEDRKNWQVLVKAWQLLIERLGGRTPLLVFAGKYGLGGAEFQQYVNGHPELAARIHVLSAASDHALAWLYGNAVCTVLASHVEGWGLPVGESAWFGKLCIASRATSIPEVCGDIMEYFDPEKVDSLAASLHRAVVDAVYREGKERIIRAAPLRSWLDVAESVNEFVTGGARSRSAATK